MTKKMNCKTSILQERDKRLMGKLIIYARQTKKANTKILFLMSTKNVNWNKIIDQNYCVFDV
jgi:hypothetical protein